MFYIIQQLKGKLDRAWFDFRCRKIYKTPPVKCDPNSDVVVVSQLHHPDMTMYMLAAKSFARFVQPAGFIVVDDGLYPHDRKILAAHFKEIQFIPRRDVKVGSCPSGGCWERIFSLARENKKHYVIQLDSDTLTINEPTEVMECITQTRTFTLGTSSGRDFLTLEHASRYAHEHACEHVQNHAERALGFYPGKERLKYVRGCAGFVGFARGQLSTIQIEEFSNQMEHLVGAKKWREWGTEQVTSNFMAANASDAMVLPVERYPFWAPDLDVRKSAFVHFFGTFRFKAGEYVRQSVSVINQLFG